MLYHFLATFMRFAISLVVVVLTMVGDILSSPKKPAAALVPEPLDSALSVPPLPVSSVRSLAARFEKNPNIRATAVDFTANGY